MRASALFALVDPNVLDFADELRCPLSFQGSVLRNDDRQISTLDNIVNQRWLAVVDTARQPPACGQQENESGDKESRRPIRWSHWRLYHNLAAAELKRSLPAGLARCGRRKSL